LFSRKPPEWQEYLTVSIAQPEGPGGLWIYIISGKGPDGTVYTDRSRKGYDSKLYAHKGGEIMADRVYKDAIKRGIVWARLDAPPVPARRDWQEWMTVSVRQPAGLGGQWTYEIAWKAGDGTVSREVSEDCYVYESAARETGENLAAHLYDQLVARGVIPGRAQGRPAGR
jgi:hypothetical protein